MKLRKIKASKKCSQAKVYDLISTSGIKITNLQNLTSFGMFSRYCENLFAYVYICLLIVWVNEADTIQT